MGTDTLSAHHKRWLWKYLPARAVRWYFFYQWIAFISGWQCWLLCDQSTEGPFLTSVDVRPVKCKYYGCSGLYCSNGTSTKHTVTSNQIAHQRWLTCEAHVTDGGDCSVSNYRFWSQVVYVQSIQWLPIELLIKDTGCESTLHPIVTMKVIYPSILLSRLHNSLLPAASIN